MASKKRDRIAGIGAPNKKVKGNKILSELIELGILEDQEPVCYLRKKDGAILKEGRVSYAGVVCLCCNVIFPLAAFELHAGSKAKRPAANMFLRGGRISLAACEAKALLLKENGANSRVLARDSEAEAVVDKLGSRNEVYESDEMEKSENLDAGFWKFSQEVVDPVIKRKRTSRKSRYKEFSRKAAISDAVMSKEVQKLEPDEKKTELSERLGIDNTEDYCAVCGAGGNLVICENCPSVFHPECIDLEEVPEGQWFCPFCCCNVCKFVVSKSTPVWSCKQCQLKFHNSCSTSAEGFCSPKCSTIFRRLKKLLGKRNTLDQRQNLSWSLLSNPPSNLSVENPSIAKLPLALGLLQTCFQPYIDLETGIDKVSHAVNSGYSSIERLDYTGFYTIILEHKGMVVSAATIRVHGEYCAEMPFICTHPKIEKKGMCRKLVGAIEDLLGSLGVRFLVLPAIEEAAPMWVSSFGFQAINSEMKQELLARKVLMCHGSKMLQKELSNYQCDPLEPGTPLLSPRSGVFPCQAYAEEDNLGSFFGTPMKVVSVQ